MKQTYLVIPAALALVLLVGATWYFGFRETPPTGVSGNPVNELGLDTNTLSNTNQTQNTNTAAGTCTPTITLTEGPYYKSGSPERTNISPAGTPGSPLTLTGRVFDTNCRPIAGAVLDFWQADGSGVYDNAGYDFRGHQTTKAAGVYILNTVIPGEYPGRTEHIHVKVKRPGGEFITTQLFFPGVTQNATDSIYADSLLVDLTSDQASARYDFVLN